MRLTPEQKRYIREHHGRMAVRTMAGHLGISPKQVRGALRELGLVAAEVAERRADERRRSGRGRQRARLGRMWAWCRRAGPGFGLVLGLAAAVRLLHVWLAGDSPLSQHLVGDEALFHRLALRVAAGDWLGLEQPVFERAPLYPRFVAAIYALAGPAPEAVRWVQALLAGLSAGWVLLLGRRVFGPTAGLLAGLLAALYGPLIFHGQLLLPETLLIALLLGGLLLLAGALQRPGWIRWPLAGACLGLLVAGRGSLVLLLPLVLLAAFFGLGPQRPRRRLLGWTVCGLVALGMAAAPGVHNLVLGGQWVALSADAGPALYRGSGPTASGLAAGAPRYRGLLLGFGAAERQRAHRAVAARALGRPRPPAGAVSAFWLEQTFTERAAAPGAAVGRGRRLLTKLAYAVNDVEVADSRSYAQARRLPGALGPPWPTFGLVAPLGLFGLLITLRGWRKRGLLTAAALAALAGLLALGISSSLRLLLVPPLLIYAAAVLRWLWSKAARRQWLRLAASLLVLGLGYAAAFWPLPPAGERLANIRLATALRSAGQPKAALAALDRVDRGTEVGAGGSGAGGSGEPIGGSGESIDRNSLGIQGRVALARGRCRAALGQRAAAAVALQRAVRLAQASGDRLGAQRARAGLARLAGRRPPPIEAAFGPPPAPKKPATKSVGPGAEAPAAPPAEPEEPAATGGKAVPDRPERVRLAPPGSPLPR
jgi:4-amino-4-deoxy-L-arabinose transferase-like glycosyltransferase